MKQLILLLYFSFFANEFAVAGGEHIKTQKVSFEEGLLGSYVLKLNILGDGVYKKAYRGCSTLIINGRYNFWKWGVVGRKPSITYKEHKKL